MSAPRVKLTIEATTREEIVKWLEVEAADKAGSIADGVKAAVDAFDFDAAVQVVCQQELDKFVRDTAGVYFRTLLKSPDAHAAILMTLQNQIESEA